MYSSPVVANGRVYVTTPNGIQFLDETTGKQVWNTALAGAFYSPPAFAGSSIYAASTAGGVFALNTSGAKVRSALTSVDFAYAAPFVADGAMYALNAATGATVWTAFGQGAFRQPLGRAANGRKLQPACRTK